MKFVGLLFAVPVLWAQATGSITGIVTDAATHSPIAKARVSAADSVDETDANGAFTLADLPPGTVKIHVKRQSYREGDAEIALSAGDLLKRNFELRPMARVTVKISDQQTGEPLGMWLATLRRVKETRQPGSVAMAMGGKSGEYALDVGGAGDYTLEARPASQAAIAWEPKDPPKQRRWYAPVQYPPTIHIAEGERRTIDLAVAPVKAFSATCAIELPSRLEGPMAMAVSDTTEYFTSTGSVGKRGPGWFRMEGLTPGLHTLSVEATSASDRAFGEVSFNVSDHDPDGLKIVLAPGLDVTGSVRMLEQDATLPSPLAVNLMPLNNGPRREHMIVEDGQFHMEKIGPGEYRAELTRLPDGYAVTDLLLGNVSTQGHALVLSGGSELTFVVTSKPGMITGTIRDKNQAPLKGAEVVLIPLQSDDPELWRRTASGEGGAFSFRNLPPGKYRIEGGAEVEVKAAEQAGVDVVR